MAWLVELQAIIQGNYIHSTILTLFRRSKASQDQLTEFIRPQTTDDYPLTAPYTVFQMVHMCFTCSVAARIRNIRKLHYYCTHAQLNVILTSLELKQYIIDGVTVT